MKQSILRGWNEVQDGMTSQGETHLCEPCRLILYATADIFTELIFKNGLLAFWTNQLSGAFYFISQLKFERLNLIRLQRLRSWVYLLSLTQKMKWQSYLLWKVGGKCFNIIFAVIFISQSKMLLLLLLLSLPSAVNWQWVWNMTSPQSLSLSMWSLHLCWYLFTVCGVFPLLARLAPVVYSFHDIWPNHLGLHFRITSVACPNKSNAS